MVLITRRTAKRQQISTRVYGRDDSSARWPQLTTSRASDTNDRVLRNMCSHFSYLGEPARKKNATVKIIRHSPNPSHLFDRVTDAAKFWIKKKKTTLPFTYWNVKNRTHSTVCMFPSHLKRGCFVRMFGRLFRQWERWCSTAVEILFTRFAYNVPEVPTRTPWRQYAWYQRSVCMNITRKNKLHFKTPDPLQAKRSGKEKMRKKRSAPRVPTWSLGKICAKNEHLVFTNTGPVRTGNRNTGAAAIAAPQAGTQRVYYTLSPSAMAHLPHCRTSEVAISKPNHLCVRVQCTSSKDRQN